MTRSKRREDYEPPRVPADLLTRRALLAKAKAAAGDAMDEASALTELEAQARRWGECQAVDAPYDPETLIGLVEMSAHLSPNIDGYIANIDGYGHQLAPCEPWMADLTSEAASVAVRDLLRVEDWAESQDATDEQGVAPLPPPVDDARVESTLAMLDEQIERESYIGKAWFANCGLDRSWQDIRRDVRWDREANGWGCIEFIRDATGKLRRIGYIPAYTVRPVVDLGEAIEVEEQDALTLLSRNRTVRIMKRFRRYVQIVNARRVYFKSPGDPRVISRTTGKIYPNLAALRKPDDRGGEGKDAMAAHELLWVSGHNPRTPCPPPRWIGALLRVLGSREADETNYYHLKNKTMSGGILFVFGGRVPAGVKERLEARLINELQGSRNTSRILVVEAMPVGAAPGERSLQPQMQFQSLRDANPSDAMFSKYDQESADAIGATFRQSPLLRGRTPSDLNRATAEAALHFAEQQVYQPERESFDWLVNQYIMPEIGVHLLKFRSNSAPARSLQEITDLLKVAAPAGALLPEEQRALLGDVLNISLERIEDSWARWPMPMTLAGIMSPDSESAPQDELRQVSQDMEMIKAKVAQITSDELRLSGVEADVEAGWIGGGK